MDILNVRGAMFVLGGAVILSGCGNSEKSDFIVQCTEQKNSESRCECVYDFAEKSLDTSAQFELFAGAFLKDQKRYATTQASLGMIEIATAMGKVAWMTPHMEAVCAE